MTAGLQNVNLLCSH